jgi:rod shape-determining protein MreD
MKWSAFIILAVVTLVLQTTLVPAIEIGATRPSWMFVLAVFYGLWGTWPDAAIAAWLLGLGVDLQSAGAGGGRIALHAFCYGGAVWAMIHIRAAFVRDHLVTQFMMTLVFGFAVQLIVEAYRYWTVGGVSSEHGVWAPAMWTALYTAACAPWLHWLLLRLRRWAGLKAVHRV